MTKNKSLLKLIDKDMFKESYIILLLLVSCNLGMQDGDKYSKYIGKEVKVFIEDPEYSNYKGYTYIHDPVTVFRGIRLKYDTIHVNLYTGKLHYVEQVSKTLEWDFENVKKEKVSRITIIGGQGLIYDSANNKE